MTKRSHTFVVDHASCEISILVLSYENGWVVEVLVSGEDFTLPKWRDHDNCYKDIEEARTAGMHWAKVRINENGRKRG